MRLTADAQRMLSERGLDVNLAIEKGWSSEQNPGGEALVIPYILNGDTVNHKYRYLDRKKFYQDPEAVKSLWNGDVLLKDQTPDTVIITEGEPDALAILGCGFEAVVSVPDGAPAQAGGTGSKYSFLEPYLEAFKRVTRIVLAVDGDGPGQNLLKDLSQRLGEYKCWWVDWPRDLADKDPNGMLLEYGQDALMQILMRTKPCEIEDVFLLSQIPNLPDPQIYSTGIRALDPHWKMVAGYLTTVTGIPGDGKTALVHDISCRAAEQNKRICISSFEQHPARHHKRALRQWHCRAFLDYATAEQIAAADQWIDDHFVFAFPLSQKAPTMDWLFEKWRAAYDRYHFDVAIIDPWNELEHLRDNGQSMTEYVGEALRDMRKWFERRDVNGIIVAHPKKLVRGEDCSLYSISDSAHWANKSDIGVVIKRDRQTGSTEVQVKKVKYEDLGFKPGTAELRFNVTNKRYHELGEAT